MKVLTDFSANLLLCTMLLFLLLTRSIVTIRSRTSPFPFLPFFPLHLVRFTWPLAKAPFSKALPDEDRGSGYGGPSPVCWACKNITFLIFAIVSIVQSEQFKNQPMDTSPSPCCSGRSLYGMQVVVFLLTTQSIESSILKTTNPCHSADLKDLRCSYQISCILKIKFNTCSYTEEVAKAMKYICN